MKSTLCCHALFRLAAYCLLALFAPSAHAWNSTGHMTVASIAYDHLKPAVRARVDAILATQRDYPLWLSEMPAGYHDKGRFAFEKANTWPDDIRGTSDSHPTWHYIDVPIIAPGFTPNPGSVAVPTPNAETQIAAETAVLCDKLAADPDKAIALCWVAHLIGDIHMPLHDSNYFSPLFPTGDRGGNDENLSRDQFADDPLEQAADPWRLHAFWDDLLGRSTDPSDIAKYAASLETLDSPDKMPQFKKNITVHSWIMEGHDIAIKDVYLSFKLPISANPSGEGNSATVTLPAGYIANSRKIADQQITLAGFRLAAWLNRALGKQ